MAFTLPSRDVELKPFQKITMHAVGYLDGSRAAYNEIVLDVQVGR